LILVVVLYAKVNENETNDVANQIPNK